MPTRQERLRRAQLELEKAVAVTMKVMRPLIRPPIVASGISPRSLSSVLTLPL